jgi:hypothetical protein
MMPWLILAAVLAIGIAGVGGYAFGHHVEALAFEKFQAQEKAVAEQELAGAQADARTKEQTAASKLAFIDAGYQTQIQTLQDQSHDQQQTYEAALRGVDNGTLRLRYADSGTGRASGNQVAAGASGSDAAGASSNTTELPVPVSEFLVDEASRADDLAVLDAQRAQQVTALQALVTQYRLTCNGVPLGVAQ